MSYEQPAWGVKLSKKFPIPQRYMMTFFGTTSIMNCYCMRNCISVAITKLVKPINHTLHEAACPKQGETIQSAAHLEPGEYDWSQEMQGYILSAFFIGYCISHLPGGALADLVGAKWVLNIGILLAGIVTLLSPPLIDLGGYWVLVTTRVLIGIAQGVIFPACSTLMAHWAPPKERASLGAMVMSGGILGQIIATTASGSLLSFYNWPMVFYVFGICALLWCLFFTFMGYSDPHLHPYIKQEELAHLEAELGVVKASNFKGIPWWKIFTSVPMWALLCCQIGHDWGLFTVTSDLPKYMNDVLQFNVFTTGLVSSAPFFCMWVCSVIIGFVSDVIIRSGKMSLTNVRKLMTIIAQVGPGVFMVAASYAGCDKTLVPVFFCISLLLMGPYFSGMKLTAIDMSPNFSGILMAIANGTGSLSGFFAATCIGWLTPNTSLTEWRIVFWLTCVILTVTGIVFCIWGTGEVQPWNEVKKKEAEEKKN